MEAADGKQYLTDVADPETLLRGGIAKKARRELEAKTGRKVVTGENFLPPDERKTLPGQGNKKIK